MDIYDLYDLDRDLSNVRNHVNPVNTHVNTVNHVKSILCILPSLTCAMLFIDLYILLKCFTPRQSCQPFQSIL